MIMDNNPLQQLRDIENKVSLMFETRQYIEDLGSQNLEVRKKLSEAEGVAERDRK